nr:AEC family transporter [Paratractidigestivibacter sp.]
MVSVAVGFVCFFCSFEPAGAIDSFLDGMANLNTGLGMLLLGVFLAQSDLRALLRTRSIYKASFLRLIVVTGITVLLLAVWPMPVPCKAVILIAFAAPCGTLSSMFPQLFGGDYRFGAGLSTVSTILSIVTMPLMLMFGLRLY